MIGKSLVAIAASVGLVAAQEFLVQTGPFNLVLSSTVNKTLNGQILGACHAGAAVESLCLYTAVDDPSFYEFYFNTTAPPEQGETTLGLLTWNEVGNNFVYNEPLALITNPASNLAFPLIWPDESVQQTIAFTETDALGVLVSVDDTAKPPNVYPDGQAVLTERWVVCETYFQGYSYTALQWVLGDRKPQNPSCQAVTVKKVSV
ncbi:hypothetical protein BX600DRAFT_516274 [Xylariales sp. PMI_506]|nr:hypothetical protein BX600DRAFT_516274 [Xylariales sp. PMI_506]